MKIFSSFITKFLICMFILLNFLAISASNWPSWINRYVTNSFPVSISKPLIEMVGHKPYYYLKLYSYHVGLDNTWHMFSYMYRDDWKVVFYGISSKGEKKLLPLPLQTERTWFQHNMVDIKEAKFLLNIFGVPNAKKSYMNYLCKQFSSMQLIEIKMFKEAYDILPRNIALNKGEFLDTELKSHLLGDYKCE